MAGEGDFDPKEVSEAAQRLGWPVLATATSGLRAFEVVTTYHHLLVTGVPDVLRPDLVVTIGRIGPSDRLGSLTSLPVPQVPCGSLGSLERPAPAFDPPPSGRSGPDPRRLPPAPDDRFLRSWLEADATMRSALDEHLSADESPSGPAVAQALDPVDDMVVVAASSMPVRDVGAHLARRQGG